jgi:hypothetical protein
MTAFFGWSGWPFVGIVVAVAAVAVPVVMSLHTRRERKEAEARARADVRNRVSFNSTARAIVSDRFQSAIEVSYLGRPLTRPWVLDITLTNVGTHDITSRHFHDGEPLWLSLRNARVVALLEQHSGSPNWRVLADAEESRIGISPMHLPVGTRLSFTCLIDGESPHLNVGALVDTDFGDAPSTTTSKSREDRSLRKRIERGDLFAIWIFPGACLVTMGIWAVLVWNAGK